MASSTVLELAAGDAHHVADHQQRERLREHLDEVDLALLAEAVDHLGADRLDRVEHALRAAAGVNERATMPRWRAWRGSSMLMNDPKNSSASAGMSGIDTAPLPEQKSCGRRLISTTSS